MDEWLAAVGNSPELFPHALDLPDDIVSFIRLRRSDYAAASFLDSRILTAQTPRYLARWRDVAAAIDAAGLRETCAYIFHIGHAGSTLLSRLVGSHPAAFALREPLLLRTFAEFAAGSSLQPLVEDVDTRLGGCLKLLSRTFDPRQVAVIKATSFVAELAAGLLSRTAAPRAVLMVLPPESFLATILGGPNSRQEAKRLAAGRLSRLHRRIGASIWRPEALSEGELIALGWATEMSALAQAARVADERALCVNFDRLLAEPTDSLRDVLRHLGIAASPSEVEAIIAGPDMHRYSKAPEHAYDAALRLEVLNAARSAHGREIGRGLALLERGAKEFAPLRDALELIDSGTTVQAPAAPA
jgi:hypothetical protein